jgi:hypothetical protein
MRLFKELVFQSDLLKKDSNKLQTPHRDLRPFQYQNDQLIHVLNQSDNEAEPMNNNSITNIKLANSNSQPQQSQTKNNMTNISHKNSVPKLQKKNTNITLSRALARPYI